MKTMMKKLLTAALLTLSLSAASALAEPLDEFKGLSGTLDIAGGTAHIPVMKKAAQNIMSAYPDIRISVAGGGTGVGVKQVGEGLAAIGNTGRPLKDEEISKYGLVTFPFAIDGVAVAVHPDNPVKSLSGEQIMDIYLRTGRSSAGSPGRSTSTAVRTAAGPARPSPTSCSARRSSPRRSTSSAPTAR